MLDGRVCEEEEGTGRRDGMVRRDGGYRESEDGESKDGKS